MGKTRSTGFQLTKSHISRWEFLGLLVLAIVFDSVVEFAFGGILPIWGDIYDIIMLLILRWRLGNIAYIVALELVPVGFVDAIPIYTVAVLAAWAFAEATHKIKKS